MMRSLPATIGNRVLPRQNGAAWFAVVASLLAGGAAFGGYYGWYVVVNAIVTGSMWALVALSLALVFGIMQIPSFAIGEYFMAGAVTSYFVFHNLPSSGSARAGWMLPLIAIAAGVVVGALLGVVTDLAILRPLRRRAGSNWIVRTFVVTIGISVLLQNGEEVALGPNYYGVSQWWSGGVEILGVRVTSDSIASTAIGLAAIAFVSWFLKRTRLGLRMRAVSDDEVGASLQAIPISRVHLMSYTMSCALAALAGGVLLFLFPASPTVGAEPLLLAWIVIVISGLGSVAGAAICAYVVALLNGVTDQVFGPQWESLVLVVLIIAVLLIWPRGLFGTRESGLWME
jgi:branched-chain amino acid transport system permease protein